MSTSNAKGGELTVSDGSDFTLRGGKNGELVVQELHGRYYETNYRKHLFSVCAQAVLTSTVGLAATYTGLCVSNPIASGYNLVLSKVGIIQSVIQSTQVEGYLLGVGYSATSNVTHTTPATPQSCLIGSGLSAVAKADTAATLAGTSLYDTPLTATGTATADSTFGLFDFEGSKILIPGAYAFIATPTQASVAGLWLSMTWEEVPI